MILLIEDDVHYANLLRAHLTSQGLEVVHKKDLLDLSPIAQISSFDLIILDYHLHYLSGGEIAEFVRNIADDELAIIMISADNRVASKVPQGVKLFFHKSKPMEQLTSICVKELERKKLVRYYQSR